MNALVAVILLSLSGMVFAEAEAQDKDYYGDRSRGWFWYEKQPVAEELEEEEKPEEPKPAQVSIATPPQGQPLSPRERLKQQGEEWEDALALAIMEPSEKNYVAYMEKTKAIQAQSEGFALGFKRSLWVNPEYDYTLEKPRDTPAMIGANDQKNAIDDTTLRTMAQSNGIIFYFRSDCPFCHRFAPILKHFSEQYGFTVIPVSMDGEGLPEYPYPKSDHELAEKLNVTTVPAIFLVNPDTSQVATIGYGFNDWLKLKEKTLYAGQQLLASLTGEGE